MNASVPSRTNASLEERRGLKMAVAILALAIVLPIGPWLNGSDVDALGGAGFAALVQAIAE